MPEGKGAKQKVGQFMSHLGTMLRVMHLDDASVCACLLLVSGLPGVWRRSGSLVR